MRLIIAYTVATLAVAVVVVATLSPVDPWPARSTLLVLLALTALAGLRPVRLTALGTELVATDAFVLATVAAAGGRAAAAAALAGIAGSLLARRQRPSLLRFLLNAAILVVATSAAGHAFSRLVRPGADVSELLPPLFAATVAYYLINVLLVSTTIAIERRQPLLATLQRSGMIAVGSAATALGVAATALLVLAGLGPLGLAIAVPPCWLLAELHRSYGERIERQKRRLATVEHRNADLEARVSARTRELEDALSRLAETNERLRAANTDLTAANRAKSGFLARVSHELRTPLNAVLGFSEFLLDPGTGPLSERQREFVSDIHRSGDHLLHLINELIDLTQIETGRMQVHRVRTEVATLLEEAAAMLRLQASGKGVELATCTEIGGHDALVDPGLVRQILVNLTGNAVKFTGPGGRVTIEAKAASHDLLLLVTDTGIGIDPADHARVFEEFFQVDGSYARRYQGTGLGLAVARRLVELHGGAIALDSELGAGARLTCRLPNCLTGAPETAGCPVVEDSPLTAARCEVASGLHPDDPTW